MKVKIHTFEFPQLLDFVVVYAQKIVLFFKNPVCLFVKNHHYACICLFFWIFLTCGYVLVRDVWRQKKGERQLRNCGPNLESRSTGILRKYIISEVLMKEFFCIICREKHEFSTSRKVIKLECGHFFCYGCLREWIQVKSNCPLCRRNVI